MMLGRYNFQVAQPSERCFTSNDVRDYADKLMDRLEDALTQQDSTINEFKGGKAQQY